MKPGGEVESEGGVFCILRSGRYVSGLGYAGAFMPREYVDAAGLESRFLPERLALDLALPHEALPSEHGC